MSRRLLPQLLRRVKELCSAVRTVHSIESVHSTENDEEVGVLARLMRAVNEFRFVVW